MRVQIPAYTDAWMKGDRYGYVEKVKYNRVADCEFADVKLDKSGKTIRVKLNDCTPID